MSFSRRRMERQQLRMFSKTGQVITLWLRKDLPEPFQSPDLFANDTEPLEGTGDLTKVYIMGSFVEQQGLENASPIGRVRYVKGVLSVPAMYRTYLAKATYIDPYNNGSRFRKCGAIFEEERLFISQEIESVWLPGIGDEV